ncbi:MAG: STAS domain-containing protein [Candidatus Auribacterota bacterium]|jgi:anti-sigma B factor antagonist|nr:STAS domain-containing protein [Candidatus Auribacterota bacterium]
MPLECVVSTDELYYLITVEGEMTSGCCNVVLDITHGQIPSIDRPVIMDMSGVEYIDSRGIGIIVSLFTHIKKTGYQFLLVSVRPNVLKIIKMTALQTILSLHPTIDSALSEINGNRP